MAQTAEDVAKTQALFRAVNERIRELEHGWDQRRVDFMCECGDAACFDPITVTLRDFDDVRSCPRYFMVLPVHVTAGAERVVGESGQFVVVEKTQEGDPQPGA